MLRDVLTGRIRRAAARAAEAAATPFYLFDPAELLRRARCWRRAAESEGPIRLLYPYKCNRTPEILRLLADEGLGAEVTSFADLRRAADLGLTGERIVIQGPAKDTPLIDAGLHAGALFVADGKEDARAILARVRAVSCPARYLLRFRSADVTEEQRPFGLSGRDLVDLAGALRHGSEPLPTGIAFHLGTGIPSAAPYRRSLREAAEVSRALNRLGVPVKVLDAGGGFAALSESRLDARGRPSPPGKAPSALLPGLAREARRLLGPDVSLLVEPGRALVSSSLHLVARVVRVKGAGAATTIYLDASRLAHGFFVARGAHPIVAIPRRRGKRRTVALAGPLGVGLDVFTTAARLSAVRPGDLVVIGSVGAYNGNAASTWAGPRPRRLTISELI